MEGQKSAGKQLLTNYLRHVDTHNRQCAVWINYRELFSRGNIQGRNIEMTRRTVFQEESGENGNSCQLCNWSTCMSIRKEVVERAHAEATVIQETVIHVQEEREMWRQRRLEKQQSHYEKADRPQRGPPLVRGRLVSDTLSPSRSSKRDSSPPSYYWTRLLMKEEESDPFRWGHSGYKELHPEEFESTDDDRSVREKERGGRKVKKKQKRKKRHKKEQKKQTHRDDSNSEDVARSCKSRKVQKLRMKVWRRDSSDSDSESISQRGISTQSRKKKLSSSKRVTSDSKGKSRASKRSKSSRDFDPSVSSDTYSDSQSSYTDHDQPKRKRRKNG